jgi:hypothetical protein
MVHRIAMRVCLIAASAGENQANVAPSEGIFRRIGDRALKPIVKI